MTIQNESKTKKKQQKKYSETMVRERDTALKQKQIEYECMISFQFLCLLCSSVNSIYGTETKRGRK